MTITGQTYIRDIVADSPDSLPVLSSFGLDLCCGGGHPLADACLAHDLNLDDVLRALEATIPALTRPVAN